jgi:hypothetical protein
MYANANPIENSDPTGQFAMGAFGAAAAIGAILGAVSVMVADYALGKPIALMDIAIGASFGALLGPLSVASPAIGAGVGVISTLGSAGICIEVFSGNNHTIGQKVAASALLLASLGGTVAAYKAVGSSGVNYGRGTAAANWALHEASVEDFVGFCARNGIEVVATRVNVRGFTRREYDVVIRSPNDRTLVGVELKSTENAFETPVIRQELNDYVTNRFGAQAFGKRAEEAGINGEWINVTYKIFWTVSQ